MTEPNYIVLRPSEELLTGKFIPEEFNGHWYDKSEMPKYFNEMKLEEIKFINSFIARPTGRFEVRDDGAVAEVWEIASE